MQLPHLLMWVTLTGPMHSSRKSQCSCTPPLAEFLGRVQQGVQDVQLAGTGCHRQQCQRVPVTAVVTLTVAVMVAAVGLTAGQRLGAAAMAAATIQRRLAAMAAAMVTRPAAVSMHWVTRLSNSS